jgi:hypothetical protein
MAYMPNITIGGLPCEIVMPGGFAHDHITCRSLEDVVGPKNVRRAGVRLMRHLSSLAVRGASLSSLMCGVCTNP